MTRETKLGLVVASSFVALTTVVVVSRLKQAQAVPAATPPPVVAGKAPPTPTSNSAGSPGPLVASPMPGATPAFGSVPLQDPNAPKVLPAVAAEPVLSSDNKSEFNGRNLQGVNTPPHRQGQPAGLARGADAARHGEPGRQACVLGGCELAPAAACSRRPGRGAERATHQRCW